MNQKSVDDLYNNVFKLLSTFFGNRKENELIKEFESKMVKKGKISPRFFKILNELINAKAKIKSGKLDAMQVDNVKKDAIELINSLVEYGQRTDLVTAEKGTMQISYQNRKAELVLLGEKNFLIEGKEIKKIENGKLRNSSKEEFEKVFADNKGKLHTSVSADVFIALEKALGKFEISL